MQASVLCSLNELRSSTFKLDRSMDRHAIISLHFWWNLARYRSDAIKVANRLETSSIRSKVKLIESRQRRWEACLRYCRCRYMEEWNRNRIKKVDKEGRRNGWENDCIYIVNHARSRVYVCVCVYARHSCLHRSRDAGLVQRSRQSWTWNSKEELPVTKSHRWDKGEVLRWFRVLARTRVH